MKKAFTFSILLLAQLLLTQGCKDKNNEICSEHLIDTIHLTTIEKHLNPYFKGDSLKFSSIIGDTLCFIFTDRTIFYETYFQYYNRFNGECQGPYYMGECEKSDCWNNYFLGVIISTTNPFKHLKAGTVIDLAISLDWDHRRSDFLAGFQFTADSIIGYDPVESGQVYAFHREMKLGPKEYNNVYELGWSQLVERQNRLIYSVFFSIGSGILGFKENTGLLYFKI